MGSPSHRSSISLTEVSNSSFAADKSVASNSSLIYDTSAVWESMRSVVDNSGSVDNSVSDAIDVNSSLSSLVRRASWSSTGSGINLSGNDSSPDLSGNNNLSCLMSICSLGSFVDSISLFEERSKANSSHTIESSDRVKPTKVSASAAPYSPPTTVASQFPPNQDNLWGSACPNLSFGYNASPIYVPPQHQHQHQHYHNLQEQSRAEFHSVSARHVPPSKRPHLPEPAQSRTHKKKPRMHKKKPRTHKKKPRTHNGKWTQEEDERLREGVKKYGSPSWSKISKHVVTRTNRMCAQRWHNHLRPESLSAKRGPWAKEEDDKLRHLLLYKYGCNGNGGRVLWELVSRDMGCRTGRQCRYRWNNYLDPCVWVGPWTEEEDQRLLSLYKQFGNVKPKHFARAFPSRPPQRIKRRIDQLLRKKTQTVVRK